jgi:hypothetical protein
MLHVARFSVGEKTDTGSTQWAHYVRDNLHKRDQVEIAGYPKAREVKAKDGSTKTVHELYVGFLKFACLFLFWNSLHVDSCEVIFLLSPSMRLQGDNVDEQQKQNQNILTSNNASVIFSVGVAILVILLVIQITVLITRRKR